MKIYELISGCVFETKKVEYKKRLDSKDPISWIKTIAAFANGDGGDLYIGVADDLELCGFDYSEIDKEIIKINNAIRGKIEPSISYEFKYIEYKCDNSIKYIIDLKVLKSNKLPIVVKENKFNIIYVRAEGSTVPASSEQIRDLIISSETISYDDVPTRELFDEKDYKKLYKVYNQRIGKNLNPKILQSIGFFDNNGYVSKGSLLFKDNCDSESTVINCSVWDGDNKGCSIVLSNEWHKGNLFDILDYGLNFINFNMRKGFIKKAYGRETLYAYPSRSILEALVNAIVHRNYYITGAQIDVDIFTDRLQITSPGSLLGVSYKDKETELANIPSRRRNNLICNVFALCNLMEKKGSGFEKILQDYAQYESDYKPYITCTNDYFSITLMDTLFKGKLESKGHFSFVPILEGKRDRDYDILNYCMDTYKTSTEICDMLGIKKSSYSLSNYIKPLINYGLLLPFTNKIQSTNQKYITNKEKLTFFND